MKIFESLKKLRQKGIQYIPQYINEKYHEKYFGINSAGFLSRDELGTSKNDSSHYEPSSYASIFKALRHIPISDQDVFIDYGSGKGRTLIVAATFPFKRIIGLELSENLNVIAQNNIRLATKKNRLKCQNIELITDDASKYIPQNDISIVMLYNPFSQQLMLHVVNQIYETLKVNPRPLYFIFRYPNWSSDIFENDSRFKLFYQFKVYSEAGEISKIYTLAD